MVGGEWQASNVYSIEELQHTKELCEIGNAASSPNASRLSTLLASDDKSILSAFPSMVNTIRSVFDTSDHAT